MGENLWDLRLDLTPKHQNMIDHGGKIDKLDLIKTKEICSTEDSDKGKEKTHHRLGEIVCKSHSQQRTHMENT